MSQESDKSNRTKQVWFLPWLETKEPISLGQCNVWPFTPDEAEKNIQDADVRAHLESYFKMYVTREGIPVNSVAICSYGTRGFSRPRDDESDLMRLAADIIMFWAICHNRRMKIIFNKNNPSPSAERFELLVQIFKPGDEFVSLSVGNCLIGGLKIGAFTFPQPFCMGHPFWKLDSIIFPAFQTLITEHSKSDLADTLKHALKWFRFAHLESNDISLDNKVVMMSTALETLLQAPMAEANKQLWIANWLDENCSFSSSIRKIWPQDNTEHTGLGHWARSFYELRNKIVHTGKAANMLYKLPNETEVEHLLMADLVIAECVIRKLYSQGCFAEFEQFNTEIRDGMFVSLTQIRDIQKKLAFVGV